MKEFKINPPIKPEGVERFITKIGRPRFVRIPENYNQNTFDYIYVDVCIIHEWNKDKMEYIQKNVDEIKQKVCNKLDKNKQFKNFGVPLNFLKLSRLTVKNNDIIEFVFEFKNI